MSNKTLNPNSSHYTFMVLTNKKKAITIVDSSSVVLTYMHSIVHRHTYTMLNRGPKILAGKYVLIPDATSYALSSFYVT